MKEKRDASEGGSVKQIKQEMSTTLSFFFGYDENHSLSACHNTRVLLLNNLCHNSDRNNVLLQRQYWFRN